MEADDAAFIKAMRRIVDNADGNENIRMPRNVLARMVELAEEGLPKPTGGRIDLGSFSVPREWDPSPETDHGNLGLHGQPQEEQ